MLEIKNVNKIFNENKKNELHVLNDINLELDDIGLVSVVGESGSGKSTLLHLIGGLDSYNGVISYDNKIYKADDLDLFRQNNIGFIFQNYLLFPNLTVYENLDYCLNALGVLDKEEKEKRIKYVLLELGIYKLRKKLAKNLSGGEQQRVSIARALIKKTKIILADEPTGNLDKANSIIIMNILKKISKTTLVILVTHNLELAKFYSDKMIHIIDGKITRGDELLKQEIVKNYDNIIYLEDYKENNINNNNVSLDIYSNDNFNINIKLIYRNNKFYLSSNKKIELINNDKLALKREKIVFNDTDKTTFNIDWYNEEKNKSNLGSFKDSIKNVFKFNRKRDKFVNVCFFALGFILAVMIALFFNSFIYSRDVVGDKNKYRLLNTETLNEPSGNEYLKFLEEGYISNLVGPIEVYVSNIKDLNSKNNGVTSPTTITFKSNFEGNIIYGINGDTIISEKLAKILYPNLSYNDIIDKYLVCNANLIKIDGICDDNIPIIYTTSYNMYLFTNFEAKKYDYVSNIFYLDDYDYELIEVNDYIDDKDGCYVLEDSEYNLGEIIHLNQHTYTIKGIIRINDFKYSFDSVFINVLDNFKTIYYYNINMLLSSYDTNYDIVLGEDVKNCNECLVPYRARFNKGTSPYEIGDYVVLDYKTTFKIVGFYEADYNATKGALILLPDVISNVYIDKNIAKSVRFNVNNENFKEYLQLNYEEYELLSDYDATKIISKEKNKESILLYGVVSIVLFIVYFISVYLVNRSRILQKQYDIAVYRSLGITKKSFYVKQIKDSLSLTLFTSTIGYILMFVVYVIIDKYASSVEMHTFILTNLMAFISGLIIMHIINIVFGLLPMVVYLKQTPASLISKYDM